MKNQKPSLKILKDFSAKYFKGGKTPAIQWKKIGSMGEADYKKNRIYLNPKQHFEKFGCGIGGSMLYRPATKIKLTAWEGYFATLLHEIAHFKFRSWKIPKKWLSLKNKLRREYPRDLEMQGYSAEDYLDQFENEMEMEDFQMYVVGGARNIPSLHVQVEEWAISEFEKKRGFINGLRS